MKTEKVNPFPSSKLDFQNDTEKAIFNGRRYFKLGKKMKTEDCNLAAPNYLAAHLFLRSSRCSNKPMRFLNEADSWFHFFFCPITSSPKVIAQAYVLQIQ